MSTKFVWVMLVVLAIASISCGIGWIWTGDERWGQTMAFPLTLFFLEFAFLPLIIGMARGDL